MKRITAILLAIGLSFAAAGCQKEETTTIEVVTVPETAARTSTQSTEISTEATTAAKPTETTEEMTAREFTDPETSVSFENYENIFVVNGAANLNVRQEPSTTAAIIGSIPEFGGGNILQESTDGDWVYIQSGAVTGYVSALYIIKGTEAVKVASEKAMTRIKISKPTVNIRESATTDSKAFATTYEGIVFDFTGKTEGFYVIQFNADKAGYIHESCVTEGLYLKEAYKIDVATEETASESTDASSETGAAVTEPTVTETTAAESAVSVPSSTAGYTPPEGQITVCIDAGHKYGGGDTEEEPNGPGSTVMKAKLTSGAQGVATGKEEHEINLEVALKLKTILVERGYSVVMIRESGDCTLSNAQRAMVANQAGADAFIRIHCNSSSDQTVTGTCTYAPTAANPYMSPELSGKCIDLAACVVNRMCDQTGFRNLGVVKNDTMTGINWAQMPVTIVEMGFLSNPAEDQALCNNDIQTKLAMGMADGIDDFFGR